MSAFVDLTNKKFGRLTIIKQARRHINNRPAWKCLCDCGATVTICGTTIRTGDSQSCGCLQKERTSKANFKHGYSSKKEYIYLVWMRINQRVTSTQLVFQRSYGPNKFHLHLPWKSFKRFKSYISKYLGPSPTKNHTIDRIKNDQGYIPGNLRWASRSEQMMNRGKFKRRKHSKYKGVTQKDSKWRAVINCNKKRIHLGYFSTEKEAATAYNTAALKYHGNYAQLNPI